MLFCFSQNERQIVVFVPTSRSCVEESTDDINSVDSCEVCTLFDIFFPEIHIFFVALAVPLSFCVLDSV